jgi:hypothetical protein
MTSELNLLRSGISAMYKHEYDRAVEVLESFCRQNTASKPSEYFEAQRWLIKAYQRSGQVDLAIYLCRQMTESTHQQTRTWAKSNLDWLQEESKLPTANIGNVSTTGLNYATSMTSGIFARKAKSEPSMQVTDIPVTSVATEPEVDRPDFVDVADTLDFDRSDFDDADDESESSSD